MTPARKLSRNFAWHEVTASGEAARRGIDNDLPIELRENAYRTAEMLERIRAALSEELGKPA